MKRFKTYLFLFPLIICIPIFLGLYVFFFDRQSRESERECLNIEEMNIQEDIKPQLKDFCIKTYSYKENSLYLEIYREGDTFEKLKGVASNSNWKDSEVKESVSYVTYTKDGSLLSILESDDTVIFSAKYECNCEKEEDSSDTDSSKPVPVPAPLPPKEPSFVVSSTEISRISTTEKFVVFTFDGGAGIQSLDKILSVLDKHDVKGTFFVTGKWAESQRGSLEKIVAGDHEVFNHTYSHPSLPTLTDEQIIEELSKGESAISKVTGKTSKPFYRPPYGARDKRVRELAAAQGYQTIYWSIDALDWKESSGITQQEVKDRILNNVNPGYIYLMHVGDNITGNILDEVFSSIKSKGYSIKSLSEVLF